MSYDNKNVEGFEMDSSIHKGIPALLELARDHSDEGRIALIKRMTDLFLASPAKLTDNEEKLVNDLVSELIKDSSENVRQTLIREFARSIDAPRDIAVRFAQAPIEIARPSLTSNANLGDEDLIQIIANNSADHAAAIATRKEITEAVADALVTTGDVSIMQIVAENMGAKLSGKAIEVMVDAARLASLLQAPILNRPELNPESAIRLFWWVSQDLRRTTLERYGFGPGKLDMALNKATEEVLASLTLQKEDDVAMSHLADWLQERGALTTSLLPHLLRVGHYRLFNIAMSRLSHLSLATIDLMNTGHGARLMVVLCRALDIEKGNFVSIFLMSRGGRKDEQIVHPRELSQAIDAYDKLHPEMAKTILDQWRADPAAAHERAETAIMQARRA